MRRPFQLAARLFTATALTFISGCRKAEMQRCVDEQYMVVDEDLCHATGEQRVFNTRARPDNFRWYYGGDGTTESGTTASNGAFEPTEGHSYKLANSSPMTRPGFGSPYAPWILGIAALLLIWRVAESRPTKR